jgi:soluble lytic murein transglycosylase-like protein
MKPKNTPLIVCAVFLLLQLMPSLSFAYEVNDSSKRKKAIASKPRETEYYTIPANVVYPNILKGNEAESKAYIEKFAASRKDYVIRMHNKGASNFPKIITTFKKYNVPEEFRVLIALESAFNGNAVSPVGAVGYWQLMDGVAKEYGISYIPRNGVTVDAKKKPLVDDRKNFTKSTTVAARYLKDRSRNLKNNVLLMVASYNCGIGNVWKAMAKSGKTNPTFWDVKQFLPMETRNYVMNFISLNVLFHNYDKLVSNKLVFNPIKAKKSDSNFEKSTAKVD